MDAKKKNFIINNLLECINEQIAELESEDSGQEDTLIGLIDLCRKATYLPIKTKHRQYVKPWRKNKVDRGSYSFLTTELLLTDEASYKNYLRVSKTQFEFLLSLLQQDVTRRNTQMRDAITPGEKLAICLRFLATVSKKAVRVGSNSHRLCCKMAISQLFGCFRREAHKLPAIAERWDILPQL